MRRHDEHRVSLLYAAARWIDESGRDLDPVVREGNFRKVFPSAPALSRPRQRSGRRNGVRRRGHLRPPALLPVAVRLLRLRGLDRRSSRGEYLAALAGREILAAEAAGRRVRLDLSGRRNAFPRPRGGDRAPSRATSAKVRGRRGAEVTLEANPEDVTGDLAAAWRAPASIGSRSGSSRLRTELEPSGGGTTRRRRPAALDLLGRADLSISADLISACPTQTAESFRGASGRYARRGSGTCRSTCSKRRSPAHRRGSASPSRALPVRRRAGRRRGWRRGRRSPPRLFALRDFQLGAPGREARHNVKYWTRTPTLGLGVSAHELWDGRRRANVSGLPAYLASLREARRPIALDEPRDSGGGRPGAGRSGPAPVRGRAASGDRGLDRRRRGPALPRTTGPGSRPVCSRGRTAASASPSAASSSRTRSSAGSSDRRAFLVRDLAAPPALGSPNAGSTERLIPRCGRAPAARASSARLLRGDLSRRDPSRFPSDEQRREHQRDRREQLDQHVERRARRVLERIADRVAHDGGLVRSRSPCRRRAPVSMYFLALSQAPPALFRKVATRMPAIVPTIRRAATASAPTPKQLEDEADGDRHADRDEARSDHLLQRARASRCRPSGRSRASRCPA